jgi:ketosteroid isomerase-like protein
MMRAAWMPLLLALIAKGAHAAPVPIDLAAAAKAFDVAQVSQDKPALERLLADDFLLFNGAGRTENKAMFVSDLTDPAVRQNPFTVSDPVAQVWDSGAVLGGTILFSGSDRGQPFSARTRFTDVWVKRGGRWQVVYVQMRREP